MRPRYRIQFPPDDVNELGQDEVYFYLVEGEERRKIRLHDYDAMYSISGLYEQVVYERLKCHSPSKVRDVLRSTIAQSDQRFTERRVLDFGAGNGMAGEVLQEDGVARIVAVDIIPEAREATERDRPEVYDAYYVADFCNLTDEQREELSSWSLDCLLSVAALGFGDIPPRAFMEAFNLIDECGWVAFNIKESFLDRSDSTGFSQLIRELMFSSYLKIYHLERYRHRLSVDGKPIYYYAVGGKKRSNVPQELLDSLTA
jgi:SAM-dependent methyltransferase